MFRVIDWKKLLVRSFAGDAAPFAVHPNDRRSARMMFHAAMSAGVRRDEIVSEAERHLSSLSCSPSFIEKQIKSVRAFPHDPRKKLHSKRAWLITWERTAGNSEVAAILSYRKSAQTVADFTEQLYIANCSSDADKLIYAKRPKDNPYPTEYDTVNGVKKTGKMTCGHNPFLLARVVNNLAVVDIEDGSEELVWEELQHRKQKASR